MMRRTRFPLVLVVLVVAAGCGSSKGATSPTTVAPDAPSTAPPPTTAPAPFNVYTATMAGQLSPNVAGVPSRAYVPNSLANTVDVIDAATFEVVDRFAVGAAPQHVTPPHDLRRLYVDNPDGNSLTPIDPLTGKPRSPIPVVAP